MATQFIGDFLGFSFNGLHSSVFNIVRTSDGNRFTTDLLPSPQDVTANIVGDDGSYYFNSTYQPLSFNFSFAYDDLSDIDIRKLRQWLGDKQQHDLILDENPYKRYLVKTVGQPKLSYICFDNADSSARVYKGEGSVQFIAYTPYAKAAFKTLEQYNDNIYPNKYEWASASQLLQSRTVPKLYDTSVNGIVSIYNAGDKDSPFNIPEFQVFSNTGNQSITYLIEGEQVARVILDMTKLTVGSHYKFDSKLKLIQGYTNDNGIYVLDNSIHNNAIAAGDFFNIEAQKTELEHQVIFDPIPNSANKITLIKKDNFDVDYDYLYN